MLYNSILVAPARNFTTSEESDISCFGMGDFLWVEESYAQTQTGDRLEAIDDNLYRVVWGEDLVQSMGVFTVFTSLQLALHELNEASLKNSQ